MLKYFFSFWHAIPMRGIIQICVLFCEAGRGEGRVSAQPGKPGKPEKSRVFWNTQGKPGKPRENDLVFLQLRENSGKFENLNSLFIWKVKRKKIKSRVFAAEEGQKNSYKLKFVK